VNLQLRVSFYRYFVLIIITIIFFLTAFLFLNKPDQTQAPFSFQDLKAVNGEKNNFESRIYDYAKTLSCDSFCFLNYRGLGNAILSKGRKLTFWDSVSVEFWRRVSRPHFLLLPILPHSTPQPIKTTKMHHLTTVELLQNKRQRNWFIYKSKNRLIERKL